MTKNEMVDSEIVKAIKKSSEKFKQLYPILEDANGQIIDGEHRRIAIKNPDTRKLDYIKTKKDRLEARLVANHARKGQNKKTWEFTLNELATILEREGVEGIGMKIASETGLPYRTIMRYLPNEFKDITQSQRASHPRLPHGTQKTAEKTKLATAQSLVQTPAESIPEKIISEPKKTLQINKISEGKNSWKNLKERPKITVQRFSNQSWRAIIVPKDFFEKLENACSKRDLDIEKAITFALMKLLEDVRSKGKCLQETI